MELPFGRTRELEDKLDAFLDTVTKTVLEAQEGVRAYLAGRQEEFQHRIETVGAHEHAADTLRRETKTALYAHSLIPESRGDVLGLLETLDNVVNDSKGVLMQFDVQMPEIPEDFAEAFNEVTEKSVRAVDSVVSAARCFFSNPTGIKDYINKVDFYESEADRAGLTLRRMIFRSDIDLAQKLHIRHFADLLESLSDTAEEVAERLTIATIKRSV